MSYTHFNRESRILLSGFLRENYDYEDIALIINKNLCSIYREIERNGELDGSYHAMKADYRSTQRRKKGKSKCHKIPNDQQLINYIEKYLKKYWSPEQIAGRLKLEHGFVIVCARTIYHYIYYHKPELNRYLRCQKGKYRRRYGTRIREKQRELSKKKRINTRPKIIEDRIRLGDWEGDTVVGKDRKSAIVTIVDRVSGYLLAEKINRATAELTRKVIVKKFKGLPLDKRNSITFDNGTEFSDYELIERDTKATVYFAYPYHSWERGTNENTNGLLRQFVPKKTSLLNYSDSYIKKAVKLINHRPRKKLGYFTPHEVFNCFCTSN